jgi:hypothetical protein
MIHQKKRRYQLIFSIILLKQKFIACAVINQIDYLVSWNYRHLANVNRERMVLATNLELGYLDKFRIITPLELIDYGNENF